MINVAQIKDTIHGLGGNASIELVNQINSDPHMDILKTVLQICISVFTLWNLWKNRTKRE